MSDYTEPDCATCPSPIVCCSQSVELSQTEVARMTERRLFRGYPAFIRLGVKKGWYMGQDGIQCNFFFKNRCLIYSHRPKACRDFTCMNKGREEFLTNEGLFQDVAEEQYRRGCRVQVRFCGMPHNPFTELEAEAKAKAEEKAVLGTLF